VKGPLSSQVGFSGQLALFQAPVPLLCNVDSVATQLAHTSMLKYSVDS